VDTRADLRTFLKAAGMNGEVKKDEYEELAQSWLNLTRAGSSEDDSTTDD
jgi:hypothetical protein